MKKIDAGEKEGQKYFNISMHVQQTCIEFIRGDDGLKNEELHGQRKCRGSLLHRKNQQQKEH